MTDFFSNSTFAEFAPLAGITTTVEGAKTLFPLTVSASLSLWVPPALSELNFAQTYNISLAEHLKDIWQRYRAFVFCLATGAVIRLIKPLLQDKAIDPAIIVIDPQGKYVISLCGSHQAGGDKLAKAIAHQLGATAIITGASNSLNLPAIDLLGETFGWAKGDGNWTGIMAASSRGEKIQVIQEAGSNLWRKKSGDLTNIFYCHSSQAEESINCAGRIWISAKARKLAPIEVQWHPRVLWIGIGCERGTAFSLINRAVKQALAQASLSPKAIAGVATISLKADEAGILELCQRQNLPLLTFTADKLAQIDTPTPSELVKQAVGTPSVAEAAAILASSQGNLIVKKTIFKQAGLGAVTVALAASKIEYTGKLGKLWLVGTGPGSIEQITPAAKTAISNADAIIGYSLYLDLIKPLCRPEQIIESFPLTQERQRGERAIKLAEWGLTVAVVSSGDCGIYGMAGLVLEQLQQRNWDGVKPQVEVFPGISALQAAAARVGAPLMHDFCTISLSDLLTPWQVIVKRLRAAASGDFVTAIYNPRSQKRQSQIITAQNIFLQHRQPDTPVVIVRAAYRQEEKVVLTTLAEMLAEEIDMLTIVIIGNSSTRNYQGWAITP
ncbi:MAG: precorrin-3B C(17)-methyltransferase, partial [Cyanobacteria bacterium J083]